MELIPVVDLMRGIAVHARRGARGKYRPVKSVLLPGQDGDALALARAYQTRLGAWRCYVADLDAIEGWAPQLKLIRALADPATGFGPGLLVDGGVTSPRAAEKLLKAGVTTLVVGLETLRGFNDLKEIVRLAGGDQVVFSLDLLEGKPVRRSARRIATQEAVALELGARAAEAGCGAILVLDLAAVGTEAGPRNLEIIDACKRLLGVRVYAGGGVRSEADLAPLEEVGCDAVLVGTALHTGGIGGLGGGGI